MGDVCFRRVRVDDAKAQRGFAFKARGDDKSLTGGQEFLTPCIIVGAGPAGSLEDDDG